MLWGKEDTDVRELSLFSGAGGGLLATKHLLGWTTVGYVEWDDYCQRVLRARIDDGLLDDAPIFGDIRTFINEGYAAAYTGMVDVVTGGFPCQPFSIAGKQAGADDPRNMWPATIGCVRVVRPRYCFFENVPGLLNSGYFPTILCDLAESGFDVRWRVLSAAELGAPHRRDRLWMVAICDTNANKRGCGEKRQQRGVGEIQEWMANEPMALEKLGARLPHPGRPDDGRRGEAGAVADANATRLALGQGQRENTRPQQSPAIRADWAPGEWWATEPRLGRVAHGVADRVGRLKALGNGQVPAVAAAAWHLLTEDIMGGVIGG